MKLKVKRPSRSYENTFKNNTSTSVSQSKGNVLSYYLVPYIIKYFKKYNLAGVKHISDPTCRYYAAFGLVKGTFTQLFGLQSFFRGFSVQAKYGNDLGKNLGDSFQISLSPKIRSNRQTIPQPKLASEFDNSFVSP